jgi:hypothetical protein
MRGKGARLAGMRGKGARLAGMRGKGAGLAGMRGKGAGLAGMRAARARGLQACAARARGLQACAAMPRARAKNGGLKLVRRASVTIVILCAAVRLGWCQTAAKGGIQGVVQDESGKPVAGATAVATGVGTSTHQSHTVTTNAAGAYSFTGLEPGQYLVCVQTPGGPHLDPCQWSKPAPITVSSGATAANQATTAVKGAVIQVRIDDPLKLMSTGKGSSAGDIVVGLLLPRDLLQPMRLASSDAGGRTYDAAIPTGTPVRVQIHSTHLQISDSVGLSLAPVGAAAGAGAGVANMASASTQTVQAPVGTGTHVMTFRVTGKK